MKTPAKTSRQSSLVQRIHAFGRWLARRDVLPDIETGSDRQHSLKRLVIWLAAPESLPRELPAHEKRRRVGGWLLAPETLPSTQHHDAPTSVSFLLWLVKPEKLPTPLEDPERKEAS